MFHIWRRMAALIVSGFGWISPPVAAQTQTAPVAVPMIKQTEIARVDRRPAKPSRKSESFSSENKKSKKFAYSYLLPFGVGQFERDKTILGTALATTQAGFLLMYFDRNNAVRSSNADAADVMRGVDTNAARNDPTIISFLDQNEKFTLKAQQQANMALLGFFALYTAGVVEAIFDPLANFGNVGSSKKKKRVSAVEASRSEDSSRLAQDLKEEQMKSKVGVFYQPAGAASALGLSVQKPL